MPRAHKSVNTEYLNLFTEGLLLWRLATASTGLVRWLALSPRPAPPKKPQTILLVVPCLIGEFAAAVPAIADFISRHPGARVDLMVTPPLLSFASAIRGINKTYPVRSIYGREEDAELEALPEQYDLIIAMRMSREAYSIVRNTRGALRTSAWPITRYALHLAGSMLARRTPQQWREFNFELLGGTPRLTSFDQLLSIESALYEKLAPLVVGEEKQIVVHTGASWSMKHWPTGKWVELLMMLNETGLYRFIFIGSGQVDEADYAAIAPKLAFPTHSLIGQLNVLETVVLMRLASGFIGVDSGPANLARLAELPSLTLYGAGPHMYLPYRPTDIAIDKTHGRGLWQMYVASERGFIHQITLAEAAEAFGRLILKG